MTLPGPSYSSSPSPPLSASSAGHPDTFAGDSASHGRAGYALVIGAPELRPASSAAMAAAGYEVVEVDDPYTGMAEVAAHAADYRAVVLSLHGLYREELQVIPALRQASGTLDQASGTSASLDIWLADLNGRSAAFAEAMRLGADGLLGEDGLHRFNSSGATRNAGQPTAGQPTAGQPTAQRATQANAARPVGTSPAGEGAGRAPAAERVREPGRQTPFAAPAAAPIADPFGIRPAREPLVPARTNGHQPADLDDTVGMESPTPQRRAHHNPSAVVEEVRPARPPEHDDRDDRDVTGEPVLSADELRALLQEPGFDGR